MAGPVVVLKPRGLNSLPIFLTPHTRRLFQNLQHSTLVPQVPSYALSRRDKLTCQPMLEAGRSHMRRQESGELPPDRYFTTTVRGPPYQATSLYGPIKVRGAVC